MTAADYIVRSSLTGERLRLLMRPPPGPMPERGFPVLYAFDGEESFSILARHAEVREAAAMATPLIVAIGYPPEEASIARRIRDLTPRCDNSVMPARPNGEPWPELGGGDDLLDAIERDVKPFIAAHCSVDRDAQTLFGHSLGGLMTIHALVSRPGSFRGYVASSPSLWVDDRRLIRDMAAFLPTFSPAQPIRFRLTVGGDEESVTDRWLREGVDRDAWAAWNKRNRLIANARELAEVVERKSRGRLDFSFELFPGHDHHSVREPAVIGALEFAMSLG